MRLARGNRCANHSAERNPELADAVTETTFDQEVLESDKPVIVDFWAEWCGPCHAVSPVLEKIVEERSDELKLVKVNIDEEQSLAMKYGIASIPTMILFKGGEPLFDPRPGGRAGRGRARRPAEGRARALARSRLLVVSRGLRPPSPAAVEGRPPGPPAPPRG